MGLLWGLNYEKLSKQLKQCLTHRICCIKAVEYICSFHQNLLSLDSRPSDELDVDGVTNADMLNVIVDLSVRMFLDEMNI